MVKQQYTVKHRKLSKELRASALCPHTWVWTDEVIHTPLANRLAPTYYAFIEYVNDTWDWVDGVAAMKWRK